MKSTKTPLTNVKSISASSSYNNCKTFAAIYDNDNKVFTLDSSNSGSTVMLDKTAKIPLTNVKSLTASNVNSLLPFLIVTTKC